VAYDEQLAQRIRVALADDTQVTEKKMFGGVAFLRRGHMFVGVANASLMARVGKGHYADSLRRNHVRETDFTGKPMQGYVFVDGGGLTTAEQLHFWLERCKAFVATLPPKAGK
jgi:hypothetical protein